MAATVTCIRKLAKRFPYGDLEGTGLGLTVRDDLMGPSMSHTNWGHLA